MQQSRSLNTRSSAQIGSNDGTFSFEDDFPNSGRSKAANTPYSRKRRHSSGGPPEYLKNMEEGNDDDDGEDMMSPHAGNRSRNSRPYVGDVPLFLDDEEDGVSTPVAGDRRRGRSSPFTPHRETQSPEESPYTPSKSTGKQTPPRPDIAHGKVVPSRAHIMKKQLDLKSLPLSIGRRILPEHDPENVEIKRLRVEENMQWSEIAAYLNAERIKRGTPGNLTDAAVYGRFTRNAPRVARLFGEPDLDPKDYMHLKPKKRQVQEPEKRAVFNAAADEALTTCVDKCHSMFWLNVSRMLEDRTGLPFTPEECFQRFNIL